MAVRNSAQISKKLVGLMSRPIIVTGGRDFSDHIMLADVLDFLNPDMIIQGGAPGADDLARNYGTTSNTHFTAGPSIPDRDHRVSSPTLSRSGQPDVVGQRILHPDYGPGTILASDGSGADQKVVIEFRGRQQKKFLLRYVASFLED